MPGHLHVRNLDDELAVRLKRRAARQGRSVEAEHREILRQALSVEWEPDFDSLAAELRACGQTPPDPCGSAPARRALRPRPPNLRLTPPARPSRG